MGVTGAVVKQISEWVLCWSMACVITASLLLKPSNITPGLGSVCLLCSSPLTSICTCAVASDSKCE